MQKSKSYALKCRLVAFRHIVYIALCVISMAYKNLSMKSDFSQTPSSRSGFDSEREAFYAELNLNEFKQIGFI